MRRSILLLFLATLVACNGVKEVFKKSTPYEEYVQSLQKSNLDQTVMGKEWIEAGQDIFNDSLTVAPPFSQTGFFQAAQPAAYGFRFEAKEGQVLVVNGRINSSKEGTLFVDLFTKNNIEWEHTAYSDSSLFIKHEFKENTECLLRLQPELLIDLSYTISVSLTPSLINPVSGASNRSIGSIYGDPRDGGNRSHEGVDIFAPRGTPVIAPTAGYITRVGNNRLGGKVIWMRDRQRGHSYYFAHLDSQAVSAGTSVKKSDTLGFVGNTGNARTTPPHLHFGIYQRGSKDPINFIRSLPEVVAELPLESGAAVQPFIVTGQKVNIRSGPGGQHDVLTTLKRNTLVNILGRSSGWYHILLPDGTKGYIYKELVDAVSEPIEKRLIREHVVLRSDADPDAVPLTELTPPVEVEVIGNFKNHLFIETPEGIQGWISTD